MKNARLLLFLSLLLIVSCGDDDQAELAALTAPEPDPTVVIAGTVRDTEGAPLGDAVVTLDQLVNGRAASIDELINGQVADEDMAPALARAAAGLRSTVTDDNGRFAFDQVAIGSYLVESRLKDHLAASMQIPKLALDTTFVDINLIPTGTISGIADRIDDANDRGNIIYVAGTSYSAISAPDGSYSMTGVPIGTIEVIAQYPGYIGDESGGTLTSAGEEIQIPPLILYPQTNILPTASFTIVESPPYFMNQTIHFVPTATDADGIVVSYEFQFDPYNIDDPIFDSFTAGPDTAETTYSSEGERVVKLRARDDYGDYGLFSRRLTIEPNQAPTVTLSGPALVPQGDIATFDALIVDPENDIALVEWDTAGGGTFDISTGLIPSLDVPATTVGPKSITVRVTDGGGLQGTDTFPYEVEAVGLFVSTSGSPGGAGTPADPLSSIQAALDQAQTQGLPRVYVATGTYNEEIDLRANIDLHGGRDPLNNWESTGQRSVVVAQGSGAADRHFVYNINAPTLTEYIEFQASLTAPASSYGMVISSSSQLEFRNCRFVARNAANGPGGSDGTLGNNGNPGGNGSQGSCDGSHGNGGAAGASFGGCPGGVGGRGGLEDGPYNGASGSTGSCGGGGGGNGGSGGDPGGPGSNGSIGASGTSGSGGSSASPTSSLTGFSSWGARTSGSGSPGTHGRGGGGGGGGGAQEGTFVNNGGGNGGGGGGGGGQGAPVGGAGGVGGQGSFAVFIIFASAQFDGCEFVTGNGGRGGNGGLGRAGGLGGLGGFGGSTCTGEIGRGGDGGRGGNGGSSGGGAGGPGGPSIGIYSEGSSQTVTNSLYFLGSAGQGGTGGSGAGNGATGIRQNIRIAP